MTINSFPKWFFPRIHQLRTNHSRFLSPFPKIPIAPTKLNLPKPMHQTASGVTKISSIDNGTRHDSPIERQSIDKQPTSSHNLKGPQKRVPIFLWFKHNLTEPRYKSPSSKEILNLIALSDNSNAEPFLDNLLLFFRHNMSVSKLTPLWSKGARRFPHIMLLRRIKRITRESQRENFFTPISHQNLEQCSTYL